MTTFDRPYATFYWSAIVNIASSCTTFELFDVDLEILVVRHSRSLKLVPFTSLSAVFYSDFYSNFGSILSHFRDKVRYGPKVAIFAYPLAFYGLTRGPSRNIVIPFGMENWDYRWVVIVVCRML